ncbi:MAG: hypothetical protein V1858_04630 [Candidatus Gottesmanbacteria bacterium]
MTPSPTETLRVRRNDLECEKVEFVDLPPVEPISPNTDGLDSFTKHNIHNRVPDGGFYFPQTQLGRNNNVSHVNFVERLLHGAIHLDREALRQLQDYYRTTLVLKEDELQKIEIELDKDSVSLIPDQSISEKLTSDTHEILLGTLYALLALDEKSQQTVIQTTRLNGASQFDFKTGVITGVKPEWITLAYPRYSFSLNILSLGSREFLISQFLSEDSGEKSVPYYIAISGPVASFAEFMQAQRATPLRENKSVLFGIGN